MPTRDPDGRALDAVRSGDPQPGDSVETALNRRVGAAARALTGEDRELDTPPRDLWDRIAAHATDTESEPDTEDDALEPAGTEPGAPWRRRGWLVAAAALVLAIVAVGAVAVGLSSGGDGTVIATARLEPLDAAEPGTGATTAEVVAQGRRHELDLDVALPPAPGFYEVWLIDPQVEGMVSLGPLRSDGRYQLPDGLDVADYPILDVSIEPPDGVPTHSGVSVLRGTLS